MEHSRRPDLEAIVAHREAEAGPGEEGQGQEAADAEWSATMLEHLGKLEAYMPKVQEVFGDALGGRSSGVEGLEEAAAQLPGRKESQDMFISIIGEMKQRVEALARMEVQLNKQASLIQLEQNRISRAAVSSAGARPRRGASRPLLLSPRL